MSHAVQVTLSKPIKIALVLLSTNVVQVTRGSKTKIVLATAMLIAVLETTGKTIQTIAPHVTLLNTAAKEILGETTLIIVIAILIQHVAPEKYGLKIKIAFATLKQTAVLIRLGL